MNSSVYLFCTCEVMKHLIIHHMHEFQHCWQVGLVHRGIWTFDFCAPRGGDQLATQLETISTHLLTSWSNDIKCATLGYFCLFKLKTLTTVKKKPGFRCNVSQTLCDLWSNTEPKRKCWAYSTNYRKILNVTTESQFDRSEQNLRKCCWTKTCGDAM